MAIRTSQLIVCIDTERPPQLLDSIPEPITSRRARVIDPRTMGELGASEWLPGDVQEKDVIRYAFADFYHRGGFRNASRDT